LASVFATLALPCAAGAQNPTEAPPTSVDGPSADIVSLSGLSIARDGTGGLVYLKNVGGVQHVFVARLLGGVFQPPEQVDGSFPAPSTQPVIAAGNGGLLLVAFVNAGSLYAVDRLSSSSGYTTPVDLADGASNPSIQMSSFGKAYLAFATTAVGGSDVRSVYYHNGIWSRQSASLNAAPADTAGTGTGRPVVAAAGDGIATIVWGERSHIYSRRVWGTSPSVVYEQVDVPSLSGWTEVSAEQPQAGVGGDSSFVGVVFDETFANGSQRQTRVLMNRLQGSRYGGVSQVDSLAMGGPSAGQPQIAVGEFGTGLVTSQNSNELFAGLLSSNVTFIGTTRVDNDLSLSTPDALPAAAGLSSFIVAWQNDGGLLGGTSIHARYYTVSGAFGPELVLSSSALGPTEAGSGLFDGGDLNGDAAAAWVQGTGSGTQIEVAQLYQEPGAPAARTSFRYARSTHPSLSWYPANDLWGPISYAVSVDGAQVGSTTATSFTVPGSISQGPHTWQVTAINPAGLQSSSRNARVWIDSVSPAVRVRVVGKRRVGATLRLVATYTDAPRGEPGVDASGIARIVVHWGDGVTQTLPPGEHRAFHRYTSRGRYRLVVVVQDRAANKTAVTKKIRIAL
jgi:hypothetical protein